MKRFAIAGVICTVASFGGSALAADLHQEYSTAITHAGMAASAPDLNGVRMHMHHVMNCLAGPGGMGYDAAMVDPCKGQGAGIIPDSTAAKRAGLEKTLAKASAVSASIDYDAAKKQAADVQTDLKQAASGM